MRFTWASHGSGEDFHQFFLLPMVVFWPLFPRHSHPIWGCSTIQFPLSQLCLYWPLLYSLTQVILPKEKEGNELKVTPITKEALWDSSLEEHHLLSLVSLLLPLAPAASLSTYERGWQTNERLHFGVALRQLQVATQGKSQLKWELLCKQCKQNARNDKLIAGEISRIWAAATKWKEQLTDKQEDQWARVWEQFATTSNLPSQVSQVDSVRLLTWFFSTAGSAGVVPTYSVDNVLTTAI